MKQENKKPLYKVLYEETGDDNLAVGMKALDQYRELATENLHHLAEALEKIDYHAPALWSYESVKDTEFIDIRVDAKTLRLIKESLNRIS